MEEGEGSGVVELKQLLGCFGLRQIDNVFFLVDAFLPCRDLSSRGLFGCIRYSAI